MKTKTDLKRSVQRMLEVKAAIQKEVEKARKKREKAKP